MIVGHFVEIYGKRGLKVSADKSKAVVFGREEDLVSGVCMNGTQLKHMSEFKYLGYVFDVSGADGVRFCKKEVSKRKVVGVTRYLVNARTLQLE